MHFFARGSLHFRRTLRVPDADADGRQRAEMPRTKAAGDPVGN